MNGINILCTRLIQPSFIEQAGKAGIHIDQIEFIRTSYSITDHHAGLIQGIPDRANLVFTSTNAVEALSQLVHEANINLPKHCRVFCVDGRTSMSISTLFPGCEIAASAESAKALAEDILKHQVEQVYFICGNLRRDELPALLLQNGIQVTELELYKTYATPVKVDHHYDGLIFFSPSAVASFFSMNTITGSTACFAIGETTANAIRECTGNEIIVSDRPRQACIIASVITYYQNR